MRMRIVVAAALLVVIGCSVAQAGRAASPSGEAELLQRTNADRAAAGLGTLAPAEDLVAVARRHAQRMADAGRIFHNGNLPNEVGGWQTIGENVGRAPTVADVHQAFMASPTHRANILRDVFSQAGVGIVEQGGQLWVVVVFRQPAAARTAAAAPAPAPAPRPAAPRASRSPAAAPPAPAPVAVTAPPEPVRSADRSAAALPGAPAPRSAAEEAGAQLAAATVPTSAPTSAPALGFVALLLLGSVAGMTTRTAHRALRS